jgi:hypothetical protein
MLAVALVSCAEPQRPRNDAYVDRLSNAICQKRVQCDPKWDGATCQKSCRERGSAARPFWRDDYVSATLACVDGAQCELALEPPALEKKCFKDTRPEPSALAKKFCDVAVEKDRTCTGLPPNVPRCLRSWGMVRDDVMNELIDCQDRPCGKAGKCAKTIVGFDKNDED